ncbi:MAG: hypothetical protein WAW45_02680 [Atribacterota bacterium]
MEFLVIIFIIISLLSSLSKQSKKSRRIEKKRKREIIFDPWSFEEEFPKDRLKREDEETVDIAVEEEKGSTFLIERDDEVKGWERERLVETITPPEEGEEFVVSPYEEEKELLEPSYFVDEEKEKISTTITAPLYLKKELTQLLRSGQLPLAILFSEILGPPRALKPVGGRFYPRINR